MQRLRGGATYASRASLDVTDEAAVAAACRGTQAVVHLAALTDVDRCEMEPDAAFNVNYEGTINVTRGAADARARVIFVSTDYVFDGMKGCEYVETDLATPLNVYGRSKREAELCVLEHPGNLVVRSSTIFGDGGNFVRTIIDAARRRAELAVVEDQVSRPTAAVDLARALWHLVDHADACGVLHVAGDGEPCSRAELAARSLAIAGISARVVGVDTETLTRRAGALPAPRPRNSSLAISRAKRLGVPVSPWVDSLHDYVRSVA